MNVTAIEDAIHAWFVAGSGLAADRIRWGLQNQPRGAAPYIALRLNEIARIGHDWRDRIDNSLVLADDVVEAVNAGADTLTLTAHAYLTADGPVQITTTGTLPGGLALATDYWVIRIDANTIKLAASFANAIATVPVPIDITSAGTGTHTIVDTPATLRAGAEIINQIRGVRVLELTATCYAAAGTGALGAAALLDTVILAARRPAVFAALVVAKIGLGAVEPVRSVDGIMNFATFEPRAILTCALHVTTEVTEVGGIITSTQVNTQSIP